MEYWQVKNYRVIIEATLKSFIRDRLLQLLFACAFLLFLSVPALSLFSMRQVQELSITLSLSAISFILLIMTVILGSSSVWRDLDRRYLVSILGLPVSRTSYILGKFTGIAIFIMIGCMLLGLVASLAIALASAQYPSDIPIRWFHIWIAILMDGMKYVLVAAVALLFSSLSTSFYFPFVATLVIYFCGSASQQVYEYISSDYGKTLSVAAKNVISSIYYCIPNFAAFDFKVQAVYPLAVSIESLLFTGFYFLIYTCVILMITVWAFGRRELA
jgi:ABC-type transport system involved in multi-copper enzyme maturation permease subunit